jgi:hypothetical protein
LDANGECRYEQSVLDCLSNREVVAEARNYLDWRYFFAGSDSIGHTTSEIARQIAGRHIRPQVGLDEFLRSRWYDSMARAPNRTALGFIVESMVISWIVAQGCVGAGNEFDARPKYKFFPASQPEIEGDEGFTIYIPQAFNFRAVDALLVHVDTSTREAIVVGVQITIAKYHSESEEPFMRRWAIYEEQLKEFCKKVSYRFLWIHEELGNKPIREEVAAVIKELKGGQRTVSPAYTRLRTTVQTVSPSIGRKLNGTHNAR